ncbi:glycosyltransferase family 2 protein [Actibacterium sp. D379-3]
MSRSGHKVLVSTMKNEGPYILEWIAYHRSIGFDDFVLFSNDCTDGSNLMLNRLDEMGVIHHFDNPLGPRMDPQRAAYSRAGKMELVRAADWVMILDADEFLNIHAGGGKLDDLIAGCGDADAVSVNWRIFGSSGQARMDTAPVTRRFTHGSDFEAPENGLVRGFKTLFRPRVFDYFGVHRPKFFKDREITPDLAKWVNGSGRDLGNALHRKGWRSSAEQAGHDLAQVNHYAVKSREEFLLKRLRGTANSKNKDRIDTGYWGNLDLNTCPDSTIRTDGIADGIAELLRDDTLAALYHATLDVARRTIDYQLEDKAWRDFVKTGVFDAPDDEPEAKKKSA